MRAAIASAAVVAMFAATASLAAGRLTPSEIQATFFTGQPFTASASNVKYKMVFTPEGKMTREPIGSGGSKGEGTWKLSGDGFCSTWKGSKANCYKVVAAGENRWSVMKGKGSVATWTK